MTKFEGQLTERIHETEEIICRFLPEPAGEYKILLEAMNYSFLAGGKRLRPLLMRELFSAFGGTEDVVEPFMAAIEMIHTYSLIHDDLPAMDNDDYRRGRKTAHIVYGENIAILAGDALLNNAFETAFLAFEKTAHTDRVIRALKILGNRAGKDGMIGGQTIDVTHEGKPVNEEILLKMYREKTGALLAASMLIGAVLAGADETALAAVEKAAYEIGLAFQIRDDILDLTGDAAVLGKPVHSDEKNSKITYVTFFGLAESEKKVQELTDSAITALRSVLMQDDFLTELLSWLVKREK
jgi:geranylgeranyl diphosphate synthase, type II